MNILKIIIIILFFSAASGCSKFSDDWRNEYLNQVTRKITIIKSRYDYDSGDYKLHTTDTTIESYNNNGQLVSLNDRIFYQYDPEGRLLLIKYCMRSCDNPETEKYYYDSLSRLIKKVVTVSEEKQYISAQYFYNDKSQLLREILGGDSTSTTIDYTYDNLNRIVTQTKKEFNSNSKKWLTYQDSIFYGNNIKRSYSKRYYSDKELIALSKFIYKDTVLLSQTDTAITTNKIYLPDKKTVHHAYFSKTEFKYNSENKIIEKITFRPDYITPSYKTTYSYR